MTLFQVLDLVQKAGYIQCHWRKDLCDKAIKHAEGLVQILTD